jgi:glycosyltransferase involved in cell wall biosynthesis
MNILFLGRDLRIGGGTTFRLNVSRGLIERGHRVWVAGQPGEMAGRLAEAGVQPLRVLPPPFNRLQLRRLVRHREIDLVHASNVGRGDDAAYLWERAKTPFVLSIHGLLAPHETRYRCLSLAPRLIAFDESVLQCLERVKTVDPRRLELVRRPIVRRTDVSLPSDGTFPIVVIGRLSRRKSQIALNAIRAFDTFAAEAPGARLAVVGGGSQLTAVQQAARGVNARRHQELVQVTGSLIDPWPVLRGAALVVGGGYAAMESLIQGKASLGAGFRGFGVVTADNVREAIAANFGDSAGDWEPTSEALLAGFREIHAAFTDPVRREQYCHLDRIVGEEHTIERVSGHLERIYQEVLAEAGNRVQATHR